MNFKEGDVAHLVEEIRRTKPGEDCRAFLILDGFLEMRAISSESSARKPIAENLRTLVGPDLAAAELSEEQVETIVEGLVDYVDSTEFPNTYAMRLLDWIRGDERPIAPAIRLLRRSLKSGGDLLVETNGNNALNILAPYQDRPEVLDAIVEAAEGGDGHVGELANEILRLRADRFSRK